MSRAVTSMTGRGWKGLVAWVAIHAAMVAIAGASARAAASPAGSIDLQASQEVFWTTVGARGSWEIGEKLALEGSVGASPWGDGFWAADAAVAYSFNPGSRVVGYVRAGAGWVDGNEEGWLTIETGPRASVGGGAKWYVARRQYVRTDLALFTMLGGEGGVGPTVTVGWGFDFGDR